MTKSLRSTLILFFLFFVSACQTSPAPTPPPVKPPVVAATPVNSPALPEPSAAAPASGLSPDGTWLVYEHQGPVVVNQDGTGRTSSAVPDCSFDAPAPVEKYPFNRAATLSGNVYLIEPLTGINMLAYSPSSPCHSAFTGNAQGGLLARIERAATTDAIPQLIIYEVPGGNIRNKFPLVKCPNGAQCDFSDANWWQVQWSPNGRYLAFPAMWAGASTDLYVYDSQDQSTRQLTNGPDKVAQVWWSPDGKSIVMGEVLKDSGAENPFTTSLWAVSVSTSDIHLLYTLDTPFPQGILGWLDNQKFVVYDGPASLKDTDKLLAKNLRLIDIASDKRQLVFDGNFTAAKLEPAGQMIVLYGKHNGDQYKQGAYLLSIGAYTVTYLGDFQPEWNDAAKLFITNAACKDDPGKTQAFDFSGKLQCVQLPLRTERNPSPDGKWRVWLQEAVRLETDGKPVMSVSKDPATQVIWCPDSTCFFYVSNQALYHVSVPDIAVQKVDEGLGKDQIVFQWLEGNSK